MSLHATTRNKHPKACRLIQEIFMFTRTPTDVFNIFNMKIALTLQSVNIVYLY